MASPREGLENITININININICKTSAMFAEQYHNFIVMSSPPWFGMRQSISGAQPPTCTPMGAPSNTVPWYGHSQGGSLLSSLTPSQPRSQLLVNSEASGTRSQLADKVR